MVFDFDFAGRAVAAQRVLAAVNIVAEYTPDKLVAVEDGEQVGCRVVHRIEVSDSDSERAHQILTEYALLDRSNS
ncbi:hypothetical protein J8F10_36705 [Gemmata sp. G18]|uniref:DUF2007 domain-containing protein n=1 Tax=Gemmata palustris TaxID=2822762 RepID=A0ABS5C4N8_9BACT|nr:hypothetical protein [Gemmata palustris]MBP3960795.1 hypothetical protein [Gemmata palustris]